MSRTRQVKLAILGVTAVLALLAALVLPQWQADAEKPPTEASLPPWRLLDPSEGFRPPEFPHRFRFPGDYGAHSEYRTEWWHLTGSLKAEEGSRIGLQLTFVRLGLDADPPKRSSEWAASEIYAGILSVSDPGAGMHSMTRTTRAALGLAGAEAEARRVWIEDWELAQSTSPEPSLDLTLRVQAKGLALTLELLNEKPLVDENDLSGRSAQTRPPFHFYIQPRLMASGFLQDAGDEIPVHGSFSLEHAWGELPLPGGPVGIDRFTLHLNDGRELLLNRTHRVAGDGEPSTRGLLFERKGGARVLAGNDIELTPAAYWESQKTGAIYPVQWLLRIPALGIDLELSPYHRAGEGSAWLPFWASAVRLAQPSSPTSDLGHGFVQLTGYERDE